jgi:hypothetical protein
MLKIEKEIQPEIRNFKLYMAVVRLNSLWGPYTGGWHWVSKGIEDGHRPPILRAGNS